MSRMYVRASFCVSNVGTISSSEVVPSESGADGVALAALDTGLGLRVAEVPSVSCPSHTNGHAPNNPTSAHVFIPRIDIFTRPARPSTSLQKSVHFLGQFTSDSFGRGNFIDARFPKPVDR